MDPWSAMNWKLGREAMARFQQQEYNTVVERMRLAVGMATIWAAAGAREALQNNNGAAIAKQEYAATFNADYFKSMFSEQMEPRY